MTTRRRTPLETETIEPHMCSVDLRLQILSRVPFFAGLDSDALAAVNRLFRERGHEAGATIFCAGDKATHLYVVADGKVKIMRHTLSGQDVLLDILVRGEFFGSLSALGDERYPDTAQAQTMSCVLEITAKDFQTVLQRYPSAALSALNIVAARLKAAHETIRQLSAHPVESRLASTLLKLADKVGERRGGEVLIQMPLSRQDLAAMTGATTETVSRAMSQFRKDGLIHTGRQWVSIADSDALSAIAAAESG